MKSLPLQFLEPWLVPLLDVKEGSWIETTTWESQLSSCRTQEAGIQYSWIARLEIALLLQFTNRVELFHP